MRLWDVQLHLDGPARSYLTSQFVLCFVSEDVCRICIKCMAAPNAPGTDCLGVQQRKGAITRERHDTYSNGSSGRIPSTSGDRRRWTMYGSGSTSDRSPAANVLSIGRVSL